MPLDEADEVGMAELVDPELGQLIGMFDAPAFARRGKDLEHGLDRLHRRCRNERHDMLAMVRLRLRQWAAVATGPQDDRDLFARPIEPLWAAADAEPPAWAARPAPRRRRLAVARDLVASCQRFNRRWLRLIQGIDLVPINQAIEHFNRYYILEKECVLGSARLAARHFEPRPPLTTEALLREHPLLDVPDLRAP